MKDLSLADAFRYMFSGVIFYIYLYVHDSSIADKISKPIGLIGVVIFLLVVGSLIYFVYRALIYNFIIIRIQDLLRFRTDNYRTYLKKQYRLETREAMQLFYLIGDNFFRDKYTRLKMTAGGIHLLYIGGILGIPFSILNMVEHHSVQILLFSFGSFFFLLGGFLLDRNYEDLELKFLLSLDEKELDSFVNKIT